MSERYPIVDIVRRTLLEQLKPFGPEATEVVLLYVAGVPYWGDDERYLADAMQVVTSSLTAAIQPTLDALDASAETHRSRAENLQAQFETFQREFEKFRQTKTDGKVH